MIQERFQFVQEPQDNIKFRLTFCDTISLVGKDGFLCMGMFRIHGPKNCGQKNENPAYFRIPPLQRQELRGNTKFRHILP
jgi:hypothetical protein